MATFLGTQATFANNTVANFRLWGKYISDRLTAVGLPKTADTGQAVWTTILIPTADVYTGYEIRRLDDALQPTAPVFFKIWYGANAGGGPGVRVQFGTGSDGVGGLTGSLSTAMDAECANVTTGTLVLVGSGDASRFVFCGGYEPVGSQLGLGFAFERTKNATGADTAEGILWTAHSVHIDPTNYAQQMVWLRTLGTPLVEDSLGALFPHGATAISGAQTMVMPLIHNKGTFLHPGLNCVGYFTGDLAPGSTFSAYMYGVAHTYYALPAYAMASSTAFRGDSSTGTESLAIRYE